MIKSNSKTPYRGIVLSALKGGSGKTILSIGIVAAWKKSGLIVSPFKKGPDYIDAGWLALAAGQPCYNLDTFLHNEETVLASFYKNSQISDVAVVEGNRGLFDGIELKGKTSTAEIAKLLQIPVFLILDCTKTTRTLAAVVNGILSFDDDLIIGGVLLNRVAGSRHESIIRQSIEHYCDVNVFGAIPKIKQTDFFPERHMGLVPTPEHNWAVQSINIAASVAQKNIDLNKMYIEASRKTKIHDNSSDDFINLPSIVNPSKIGKKSSDPTLIPKIGIIKDSAFQFYYEENIDALSAAGADIVYTSPLKDRHLPEIDALYIGGGFPETHALELDKNNEYRDHLKNLAHQGLPIYAECGGLIYLGKEIEIDQKRFQMTGIFPIIFGISKKPIGHGYTVNEVDTNNPYFKIGEVIKGHEFRYSKVLHWGGSDADLAFKTNRGTGFCNQRDGLVFKNVFAAYTHLHALGVPNWGNAMVQNALSFKKCKRDKNFF